jgi:hypothetical protein
MPADGIPRCLSTSNGDFGTSRLEEQLSEDYTIPRPFKRPILAGARRAQSAKISNPMSESDQKATSARRRGMSVLPPGTDMPVTGRFAPEAASRKPNSSDVSFRSEADIVRQISYVRKVPTRNSCIVANSGIR